MRRSQQLFATASNTSGTSCEQSDINITFHSWGKRAAHNHAQIVYYIAENLELRHDEVAQRIASMTGVYIICVCVCVIVDGILGYLVLPYDLQVNTHDLQVL